MGAGTYIGRVGALAVALGVGVAVAMGQGVALAADETDSANSSSESVDKNDDPKDQSEEQADDNADNDNAEAEAADDDAEDTSDDADEPEDESADEDPEEQAPQELEPTEQAPPEETPTEQAPPQQPAEEQPTGDDGPTPPEEPKDEQPADDQQAGEPVIDDDRPRETDDPTTDLDDLDTEGAPAVEVKQENVDVKVDEIESGAPEITTFDIEAPSEFAEPAVAMRMTTTGTVEQTPAPRALTKPTPLAAFVHRILAAVGINPLAGASPDTPTHTPLLWTMLAWTRREFERITDRLTGVTTPAEDVVTASQVEVSAAAVAPGSITYVPDLSGYTAPRGWVTGPSTDVYDPLNHTITEFDINGTDLGIMWDNGLTGENQQVLIAFGDTFSQPGMQGNWRSNVLLRTEDDLLDNGMYVAPGSTSDEYAGSPLSGPGVSKELVTGIPGTIGLFGIPSLFGSEVTMIPTAGIAIPNEDGTSARQYMNVMSVRQWGPAGQWTTNYSAIAYSDDNGQSWILDEDTIRSAGFLRTWGHAYQQGNENFQQGAFVRGVEVDANGLAVRDADGEVVHNGYVYSYGTPSGRTGSAYLSRVPEQDILELDAYEYWDGEGWSTSVGDAAPIVPPGKTNAFAGVISFANNLLGLFGIPVSIPNGDVSEMSVQYNEYLDEYIMLYTDSGGRVVMRTANTPEGPWSDTTVLATSDRYPGLYAPMIHPWSGTDKINDDPRYLYWNLSQWGPYNVEFQKTDLSPMKGV